MLYYTQFTAPLWDVILVGNEAGLTRLHMMTEWGKRAFVRSPDWKQNDKFFEVVQQEVLDFLQGKRTKFTVKINLQGTDFQKKVWQALLTIPFGEVRTYKDIATAVGNPKASRAVGMANSKNPIPLIVPCHRVIGSSGKLVGFAHGLSAKQTLLDLEKPTP